MPNTLTKSRYGRYSSGNPESATGLILGTNSRACTFDALAQHVWWNLFGFIGGKVGSNATVRLSVYEADGSMDPDDRMGYSDAITVSTVMVGGGDGTHYTADVAVADESPTNDAIMGWSGKRYALDILTTNNDIRHSMVTAAVIAADNEQFYNRTAPGSTPPDPYGAYSSSIEGHLTAYLEGWNNVQPQTPLQLTPSGSVTSTTPTFTQTFRDKNGAYGASSGDGIDTGDYCTQVQIQVRAVGSSTLLWNITYDATSAEQSSNNLSRAYTGSTLSRGTAYEWKARTADAFGTWGSFSGWETFTPASQGFITLDDVPTGKQTTIQPDFKGRWNHQTATTMKTVEVYLYNQNGVLLQTGANYNIADVSSSALPGTLFTVPWANTGFTDLNWGKTYQYKMRGYDGTNWSDLSAARSFFTNAAPTVPSNLIPSGGSPYGSLPLLSAIFSDTDDSYTGSLTGVVRITKPDTSTVDVTPTYNATTNRWEFQTTSSEVSATGTYSHKWVGYDGTLYSGEVSSLGSATFSAPQTFAFGAFPTVTIDAPADAGTVTTPSFLVQWTTSGQVKYRVVVYASGTSDQVYDSGTITSSNAFHTVPSGYVHNSRDYDIQVFITDATPLTGASDLITVTVAITPPDAPANFQATPVYTTTDLEPSAIRLSWDPVTISSGSFIAYRLFMQADGGPDEARIILEELKNILDSSYYYRHPASGFEYSFGIQVVVLDGPDEIESDDSVFATATVDLIATYLSLAENPGTYRAVLTNVTDYRISLSTDQAAYVAPVSTKPNTISGLTNYRTIDITATLKDTDKASAKERRDNLYELHAQLAPVCYRNGDGDKVFGMIASLEVEKIKGTTAYTIIMSIREEDVTEGLGVAP